jgi:LysR family transcriptional regulator of abg operon
MKLSQLRALVAVARGGSMQEAARLTHVSQPALSKAIGELERQLGVPLLVRSVKGAVLTPYGVLVERRSRVIQKEVDTILDEIKWLRGELGGRLLIGAAPAAAGSNLADAIALFSRQSPSVEIQILEMRSPQILEGLRDGSLDLGFISQFGRPAGSRFRWRELFGLEMILAAGGKFSQPLDAMAQPVALAELCGHEWLELDTADGLEGYLKSLFVMNNLPFPSRVMRCSSTSLGYELASRLDVVTCWIKRSFDQLEPRFSAGRMIELKTDIALPQLNVFLVYQDEDLLTPAALQFTRILDGVFNAQHRGVDDAH